MSGQQLPVDGSVRVRFWGVRGSVPAPGAATVRYGGNTSCVSIEAPGCDLLVFDAGTGIRQLGAELVRSGLLPLTAHLFLSHTHWDHIQGFPFFAPAFIPGNRLVVHGAQGGDQDLAEALEGQMQHRYFPVRLTDLGADILFQDLDEGTHALKGACVTVAPARHPGGCAAYRLEAGGRTIVYSTDTEPEGEYPDLKLDGNVLALAAGADVLIHDAQYTDDAYSTKVGWGHSPVSYAVRLAIAAGVGRLVLFHHDPTHDDGMVDAMVAQARAIAADYPLAHSLTIEGAAEGRDLVLPAISVLATAESVHTDGRRGAWGVRPEGRRRPSASASAGMSPNEHQVNEEAPGNALLTATNGEPVPVLKMSVDERVRLLRKAPLFRLLRDDELHPLAEACDAVAFGAGEALLRQGEPGEHVFIIAQGVVDVTVRQYEEGLVTGVHVGALGVGEALGELALVDGRPRSATAVAQTHTVCLRIGRRAFVNAARLHWSVAQGLLGVLAGRLRAADAKLGDLARDRLTGVYSLGALADLYEREVSRAARLARHAGTAASRLSLVACDVRGLRGINEVHGVRTGDEVLRAAARTLTAVVRTVDAVGRVGGDEFVVLLPETDETGARVVVERVRRLLHQRPLTPTPFTMRLGLASVDPGRRVPLTELVAAADRGAIGAIV